MLSLVTLGCEVTAAPTQGNTSDNKITASFPVKFAKVVNQQTQEVGEFPIFVKVANENMAKYVLENLGVGTGVIIAGTLIEETYENPDGSKYKSVVINASGLVPQLETPFFNAVAMIGRLGQDPELKYFESGSSVAKTSIAFSYAKGMSSWFNVKAWGKTAETMAQYVKKGQQMGVQGSFDFEQWTDKNTGNLIQKPVISAQKIELLGEKGSGGDHAQYGTPQAGQQPTQTEPQQNSAPQETQAQTKAAAPAAPW